MRPAKPIVSRRTLLERAREQMRLRAADLATRGSQHASGPSAGQMVLCAVGPDVYAIPAQRVAETLAARPVAPLPGAADSVLGLLWNGGSAVVVLHLGRLLGTRAPSGVDAQAHLLVLRMRGRRVALMVDRVLAVADVELAAPDDVASLAPTGVLQRVRVPEGLTTATIADVLDLERLIPNTAAAAAPSGA